MVFVSILIVMVFIFINNSNGESGRVSMKEISVSLGHNSVRVSENSLCGILS